MQRGTLQSKADPRYNPLNWLKPMGWYSDGLGTNRDQGP
jgi:hypothetical protein